MKRSIEVGSDVIYVLNIKHPVVYVVNDYSNVQRIYNELKQFLPVEIFIHHKQYEKSNSHIDTLIKIVKNEIDVLILHSSDIQLLLPSLDYVKHISKDHSAFDLIRDDELVKKCKNNLAVNFPNTKANGLNWYIPFMFDDYSTIFDYVQNWQYVYQSSLQNSLNTNWKEINERYNYYSSHYACIKPAKLFLTPDSVLGKLKTVNSTEVFFIPKTDIPIKSIDIYVNEILKRYKIVFAIMPQSKLTSIKKQLDDCQIPFILSEYMSCASDVTLINCYLQNSFVYENVCYVGNNDINKLFPNNELSKLKINNLVMHINHGVGKFNGFVVKTIDNIIYEMAELEYLNEAKLYVSIQNIDTIVRVSNAHKLTCLSDGKWQKTKHKIQGELDNIAAELLKTSAERAKNGKVFAITSEYELFDKRFTYQLTQDQEKTLSDVISDLTSTKIMDRVVCGDVGFGKTEIAMRTAFIVAKSAYQVAVIAPTTLLAEQLYNSFIDRFIGFNLEISLVSRMTKDAKFTLELLKNNCINIIIGTHKLLQKDVEFANLGLIIVDEEHKFGVKHKEELKRFPKVNILTMTATPIPRTLSMALEGFRDISIITTPPLQRLPIKTEVIHDENQAIQKAIKYEIARGGQVFFLYNNVKNINAMATRLAKLIPEASIAILHAQMSNSDIENSLHSFIEEKYNLLLCSTIIESGIDIPNANTILIYNAEQFGISSLHQLRGRVGRSYQQAFCYLIVNDTMSEDAEKRVDAIVNNTALGSGFNLAMQDLEIRGAGEFLGKSQAGSAGISIEIYSELLKTTINKLQDSLEKTAIR